MKTLAAVLVETGKPLELADIDVPELRPGQTLVEVACSGVCHTQVLEARGHRGHDPYVPHCLGHEGSGVVREIGPGVTKVKPGDAVILSWLKGSGADVPGSAYDWSGRSVNAGAVTTFQRLSVVSENRLTVIPEGLPVRDAALLGCAVPTGVGAVVNTARAEQGQSIAVFGAGGVGLCAIAGAAAVGCNPIIAIDILDDKLAAARQVGATHTLNPRSDAFAEQMRAIVPTGLDIAIEATGQPDVMRQALETVRPRGGVSVVIGNARAGQLLTIDPKQFNLGKRLLGTWGGDSVPDRDYPRFAALMAAGRLKLQPLIGRTYTLESINDAIDDLEAGRALRPMVLM